MPIIGMQEKKRKKRKKISTHTLSLSCKIADVRIQPMSTEKASSDNAISKDSTAGKKPSTRSDEKPSRRLTFKQAQFVNEYIKNGGNGTQAALQVYNIGGKHGTDKPEKTAEAIGSETLSKPIVRSAIKDFMNAKKLTADLVLDELMRDATDEAMRENNPAIRTKSLELLGKYLKLFREQVDANVLLADVRSIGWGAIDKENEQS